MPPWAVVLLLAVALPVQAPNPAAATPVATEFRVFDGPVEVTASTRLRVFPAGRRDAHAVVVRTPTAALLPAMYDVEARRISSGGIMMVTWAERLAVLHYPDEGGRHLEVINFQPAYGALQLRTPHGRLEAYDVGLFRAGDRSNPVATSTRGADYVLFVVPAGRYDVRVRHAEHDGAPDTHWLIGVNVPSGATRLKLIAQP